MTTRSIGFVLLALLASLQNLASVEAGNGHRNGFRQRPEGSAFGTCAWWKDPVPAATSPNSVQNQVYRVAFAQGVVLGMDADVWRAVNDYRVGSPPAAVVDLINVFLPAYRTLLAKPGLMHEALDAKCGDYRNSSVWIPKLAFLIVLETGGMRPERIESALQILRRTLIPRGTDIIEALMGR